MPDEKYRNDFDLEDALNALGLGTSELSATRPVARPLATPDPHLVENRVYKDTIISLDGYTFRNCAFISCALTTRKGNFHLSSCYFNSCVASFDGNALRVVKLSSLMLSTWQQLGEQFRATIAPDGGITIS